MRAVETTPAALLSASKEFWFSSARAIEDQPGCPVKRKRASLGGCGEPCGENRLMLLPHCDGHERHRIVAENVDDFDCDGVAAWFVVRMCGGFNSRSRF
jgi:hypothetical protein